MKKISVRAFAFAFLAAGMLVSCTSENTTGVETEGTQTEGMNESQPNMGGKTGDSAEIDSVATEENNATGNGQTPVTNDGTGTGN